MQLQIAAATWRIQARSWWTCQNDSAFCQITLVFVGITVMIYGCLFCRQRSKAGWTLCTMLSTADRSVQ